MIDSMNQLDVVYVLEIISVVSFAISGALVGVRKKMDYLGVCILGIVTSVGGGATRDVIIGRTPPVMFQNPIYVGISFAVSNLVFLFLYFHMNRKSTPVVRHFFEDAMFWFDTVGLASFTVDGVIVGQTLTDGGIFLCSFLGVITGVGGGILRDLLANEVPAIFVKHIYAMASIGGAVLACILWPVNGGLAIAASMLLIILVRILARHFRWNMPCVDHEMET